jgi:hypothetical protein
MCMCVCVCVCVCRRLSMHMETQKVQNVCVQVRHGKVRRCTRRGRRGRRGRSQWWGWRKTMIC